MQNENRKIKYEIGIMKKRFSGSDLIESESSKKFV